MKPLNEITNEEKDRLIATEIMEYERKDSPSLMQCFRWFKGKAFLMYDFEYSPTTDIAQALDALEQLRGELGVQIELGLLDDDEWWVHAFTSGNAFYSSSRGRTLPLAISNALVSYILSKREGSDDKD